MAYDRDRSNSEPSSSIQTNDVTDAPTILLNASTLIRDANANLSSHRVNESDDGPLPFPPAPPSTYPFLRTPKEPDEIGRLGDYRVLKLLGQGGMAFVFLAEDVGLHRQVALKVMKPSLLNDPSACQRFLREARTLASIKHENVVAVYQVSQEGPSVYIAMESLQGRTLDEWIDRHDSRDVATALRLGREIAAGLHAIHKNDLIHRDLKPSNIWVEEPGERIKLLDFGLARPINDNLKFTGAGFVVGTPAFMSPEQARGERLDARSDLFSLGAVLYFLCSGRLPFNAETSVGMLTAVAVEKPRPVRDINPRISKPAADLIMQLLEKQAGNRPSSAQEVIERLDALEKNHDGVPAEEQPLAPVTIKQTGTVELSAKFVQQNSNRKRTRSILIAMAAAALIAGIVFIPRWNVGAGAAPTNSEDKDHSAPIASSADIGVPGENVGMKPRGIIILDNCDEHSHGKSEYSDNLTLLDADGKPTFRISGFNACDSVGSSRMIASDRRRDCIWVFENAAHRIRRFDLTGKETCVINDVKGSALAVDPETGHVWALVGTGEYENLKTVVYDDRGEVVRSHDYSGWDIVYDPHAKAFWIAGSKLTKLTASDGQVVFTKPISLWWSASVDVDPKSGIAWVSVRTPANLGLNMGDRLLKVSPEGETLATIELGETNPFRISVDPHDGSVWVAHLKVSVEHFSADGQSLAKHSTPALSVHVDSAGGHVWVVTPTEVQKMSAKGEVKHRVRHGSPTNSAWIGSLQ